MSSLLGEGLVGAAIDDAFAGPACCCCTDGACCLFVPSGVAALLATVTLVAVFPSWGGIFNGIDDTVPDTAVASFAVGLGPGMTMVVNVGGVRPAAGLEVVTFASVELSTLREKDFISL